MLSPLPGDVGILGALIPRQEAWITPQLLDGYPHDPSFTRDNIQLKVGDTDGKEDCQYKENHLGDFGAWQDLMRKGK